MVVICFSIVVPPSQHHQMLIKSPLFAPQLCGYCSGVSDLATSGLFIQS